MDVPGATRETVEVAPGPAPGTLLVRARVKEEPVPPRRLLAERASNEPHGYRFARLLPVGWDADVSRARAVVSDGVLTVTIPRNGGSEKPRVSHA